MGPLLIWATMSLLLPALQVLCGPPCGGEAGTLRESREATSGGVSLKSSAEGAASPPLGTLIRLVVEKSV